MMGCDPASGAKRRPTLVVLAGSQNRRQPRQRRSKATVDFILTAAADLISQSDLATVTTDRIAVRAGVSIGTLYQYFQTRDAILVALKVRHLQDLADAYRPALDEAPSRKLAVVLRSAIRGLIAGHLASPRLHQVLEQDILVLPEAIASQVPGLRHIRALLEACSVEIAVTDLDLASLVLGRTFRTVINAALWAYPERLASGQIEDDLSLFAMRYLTLAA